MEDLAIFEEIIRLKRERIPAVLAIVVGSMGSAPRKAGAKMLVREDGSLVGTIGGGKIEAETVRAVPSILAEGFPRTVSFSLTEEHGLACGGQVQVYIEPISFPPHLIAVGSGHVGQALTRAARHAGFAVTLVDPHPDEAAGRVDGFLPADIICPVAEIFSRVRADRGTYILIATRGHRDDFLAVREALSTEAQYIGLVGSRRKRGALKSFLEAAGFPISAADRVISPVGLDIGAKTPEEIAVSIVAQMIQWRRSQPEGGRDSSHRGEFGTVGPTQTAPTPG
jgi:xanthine dehydrogenase accessory factor